MHSALKEESGCQQSVPVRSPGIVETLNKVSSEHKCTIVRMYTYNQFLKLAVNYGLCCDQKLKLTNIMFLKQEVNLVFLSIIDNFAI